MLLGVWPFFCCLYNFFVPKKEKCSIIFVYLRNILLILFYEY